ncbi:MAG: (d)CMP kinase [candidate division KSB1 bacterium]|nr:(d)CMP kinase [candidate division KSB1 bacterium]
MTHEKIAVIAIDGPAGSGKSTTARLVAKKLGFIYLDTGAMYRAVTLKALRRNLDLSEETQVVHLLQDTRVEFVNVSGRWQVLLDDENVTRKIRSLRVSRWVSTVAAMPAVRQWLVALQRRFGQRGRIVADGRDIGTVVFPDAQLKIFLTASLEERAKRRLKDFARSGETIDLQQVIAELKARDEKDSSRAASPLKKAPDAIELDTTHLSIEQQVDFIVQQWQDRIKN